MPKTAGRNRALRQRWLAVHLYLGLALGAILSVIGITGSLLVFYIEFDEILNPELVIQNREQLPRLPYEAVFRALRQTEPDRQHAWRLEIPNHPQRLITARYYKPQETKHENFAPLLVAVNPYSGEIIAKRFWGQFAMTWLYDLHYTLLLGQNGKIVMAVFGFLLMVSLLSGVYLWWPPLHKLLSALTFKKSASRERLNYDLHKIGGIYSLILLIMLALTGIALEVPEYINPIIEAFSPRHKMPKPESATPAVDTRISIDQAVSAAQQLFPEARLCWIETPDGETGSFRINLRQPGEPGRRFPKTNIWVDQYSGRILAINAPQQNSAGDSIVTWLHPLHSGEAFDLPGRWLVFLSGLACPLLFITGLIRWLQKCRSKQSLKYKQLEKRTAS